MNAPARSQPPWRLGILSFTFTLVAAACGDRGVPREAPVPAAPPAATPANTAAPTPSAPAAAPPVPAPVSSAASVVAADRDFMIIAASGGLLEAEASRLALERSKRADVRAFAQRMIDDHEKINGTLKAVAASAGVNDLPVTMLPLHSAHLQRLRPLNGAAFDREYAAQIGVAAHTEATALYERAINDVENQDVRRFADKTLPALRGHLQHAQTLAQAVGVSPDRMKSASLPPDLSAIGTATAGDPSGADRDSRNGTTAAAGERGTAASKSSNGK